MNKCILFFDDDPEILLVCKIILEQDNYRVETRTRCDNIINDIKEVKPDLILMDLWIPEIGGEQAVHMMKENKENQNIPVILFSANAEIEEICLRTNANGFLKKPFDVLELRKIIEENINVSSEKTQ